MVVNELVQFPFRTQGRWDFHDGTLLQLLPGRQDAVAEAIEGHRVQSE